MTISIKKPLGCKPLDPDKRNNCETTICVTISALPISYNGLYEETFDFRLESLNVVPCQCIG